MEGFVQLLMSAAKHLSQGELVLLRESWLPSDNCCRGIQGNTVS